MKNKAFVRESSELAQSMILDLHRSNPSHGTFDQVGFLDGHDVVIDYLDHGELGSALSHLLYMLHEADIPYPRDRMLQLHKLAKRIGERNLYSKENQANLTAEQRGTIHNSP